MQAMTQCKNSPEQWRCLAGGNIRPRLVRWWLAVIIAGTPTIRAFIVIFATTHHEQQGQDEYSRSAVREGNFCPNLLKIEREGGWFGTSLVAFCNPRPG
jgi:hypothetical protein